MEKVETPADTHLNACAVLSQLGRHSAALEHAQGALILLQEELFSQSALAGSLLGTQCIYYHDVPSQYVLAIFSVERVGS